MDSASCHKARNNKKYDNDDADVEDSETKLSHVLVSKS